ncbi:MAG TPA: hypothetical protein PLB32_24020 [Acidobacteriota bacterium]|nr:hypothetical protein [Acidobacteriota bacterium]
MPNNLQGRARLIICLIVIALVGVLSQSGFALCQSAHKPETRLLHLESKVLVKRAVKQYQPDYPLELRAAYIDRRFGAPTFEVIVNQTGEVVSAKPVKGISLLIQPALEAVKQWKFAPNTHRDSQSFTGLVTLEPPPEIFGDLTNPVAFYQKNATLDPESWERCCKLARAYLTTANNTPNDPTLAKAVLEYQKAFELSQTPLQKTIALWGEGEGLSQQKKYVQALAAFQEASRLMPEFYELFIEIGWLYKAVDDEEKAITTFEQLLLQPVPLCLQEMALVNIYSNEKLLNKPVPQLVKTLKRLLGTQLAQVGIDDSSPQPSSLASGYGELALYESQLGNHQEAISAWQEMIERNPVPEERLGAALQIASLYKQMGNQVEAVKMYKQQLRQIDQQLWQNPLPGTGSILYYYRGKVNEGLGKEREAIRDYQTAARHNHLFLEPHRALHRLYVQVNDTLMAQTELEIIEKIKQELRQN